ncbi:MAG TPA: TIGR04295 family B12-binding domain-containing radical SAM protein [Bryobacteraceae bacterium]|jgi:B12-binding domain/radical SAM domain protein of rhizo-twelve system
MRFSLVNPPWSFEGSIYFGCREPHLPLEFGYSKALLERKGHEVRIIDAQLDELTFRDIRRRVEDFQPDFTVVTTAPSYLFWRCAPPELRVPEETLDFIRDVAGFAVVVGPHGSTTPAATLRKLGVDAVILGECEEILPALASGDAMRSICLNESGGIAVHGAPHASDMNSLPALHWEPEVIAKHRHHHHRFDARPDAPGAEMETSRGCPYHCTFCAKDNFRNLFRRRPLEVIAEELDGLIAAGARYVYFIDEIFLPTRNVLELIGQRGIAFGIQTRIDLWNDDMIDLLGSAGCVSIEAGVESITEEGRAALDKKCRISTDAIGGKLIRAKRRVPFVQANLMDSKDDDPAAVKVWRESLIGEGVWANEPVPMFPYPGSPDYTRRWGVPDDYAWERAHEAYLSGFGAFSDIQESRPLPLVQLETGKRTHV